VEASVKLIEGVIDFRDPSEFRVDGTSGIYRVSQHTLCIELYANKIVDGKVQKVMVMRNTWDRASWLETQSMIAQILARVVALPTADGADEEVRLH
jgi:hypothetical protein